MSQSSFAGPSGVEDDNLSTARDMTRAILAASRHPTLVPAASAPFWDLHDTGRDPPPAHHQQAHQAQGHRVVAGKTGYTDTAVLLHRRVPAGGRPRGGGDHAGRPLEPAALSDVRSLLRWVAERQPGPWGGRLG